MLGIKNKINDLNKDEKNQYDKIQKSPIVKGDCYYCNIKDINVKKSPETKRLVCGWCLSWL
jgi:hypothetical protein